MTELPSSKIQASVSGAGSFDFYQDHIVTVSEEGYFKYFEINPKVEDGSVDKLKLTKNVAVSKDTSAIASNGKDIIVYGGRSKKVQTVFREKFDRPTKVAETINSVHRVIFSKAKVVLICTEANDMQLYWIEAEKCTKLTPSHEGIVLNGDVDPTGEFIATTGCDGMLHVCKLNLDPEKLELVTMQEISRKTTFGDNQQLQVAWSPDGQVLAIAGETSLRVMSRDNLQEIKTITDISHDNNISQLCWINSNILVTVDIQSILKVWNFDTNTLVYTLSHENDITCVKYSSDLKCLAFFDSEGALTVSTKDFVAEKELRSTEKKINNLGINQSVTKFDRELEELVDDDDDDKASKPKGDVDMKDDAQLENQKESQPYYTAKSRFDEDAYDKPENDFGLLIGARPQIPIMPGRALEPEDPSYKLLCWNFIGSVAIREEMGLNCIEIEFADKTFHKNLITDDDIKAEMATLSHNGALIASRGEEVDLDQYEDDTDDMKYISQIKFIPFTSWNSIKTWSFDLPKGENADCVAVGTTWCAVATDANYIRFFSLEGSQTFIMSNSNPVVAMVAYENLLCVISHSGLPMLESQNLRMKIIDVTKNFAKITESEVPLSPGSIMTWANFSEEGGLYTYDSDGIMRAFSFAMGGNWVPVLDVKHKYDIDAEKFWVIGVSEGDVTCCVLKNKTSPDQRDKSHIQTFKTCMPLLGLDSTGKADSKKNSIPDNEELYLKEYLELTHQQWRRHQWSHLRNTRTQKDPAYGLSRSIYTDVETLEKKKALDKITINSIRIAAMSHDKTKVLMYATKLHLTKSFSLCISLLEELKQPLIADEFRKIRDKKEVEEAQQREKSLSGASKVEEKSYISISEKILQNRANLANTTAAPSATTPSLVQKKQVIETKPKEQPEAVNEEPATNPFAKKKENANTINKKKNLFEDLLKKNTQKKQAGGVQAPGKAADKQKL